MNMDARRVDYWREGQCGFRGSSLLSGGGVFLAAGALLALASLGMGGARTDPGADIVVAGWMAYILGLGLVGMGFGWACAAGVLPRLGLAAAALHLAQAAYLLFVLYGRNQLPVSPVALTAGRLLALAVFAAIAANQLGRRSALVLGVAAGLCLAKTLARVFIAGADGGAAADAILLLVLAAAIVVTARRLRRVEDEWARGHHPGGRSDFSEFNNPQHEWNRAGHPQDPDHPDRTVLSGESGALNR
jgi:hypothetical protein